MADGKEISEDDSFLKEELAHVEELLYSSREECIDISSKYQDLNKQVQDLIKYKKGNESDESIESEQSETHKEFRYSIEEQLSKYENQIAAYQHSQTRQAEIVGDLQTRVEEYRLRCAKLEAALAEQKVNDAAIEDSESLNQNAFSMDLETALIRLEQEKNRCQGLTEINKLLREQLETATEVNQTLTSDVHRLTKEWQSTRSELLAKESEWKEEEQSFSMYFTKESNILLSFWREILNFKHDFANLKSSTEKDLSSFKVCICQNINNIMEMEKLHDAQEKNSTSLGSIKNDNEKKNDFVVEKEKLQERINDLIDRNEKIQWLLDEKEKVNTTLYNTIEQINTSMKTTVHKTVTEKTEVNRVEKVCKEYVKIIKYFSEMLSDDPKSELTSNIAIHSYDSVDGNMEAFSEENISRFDSVVSAMKKTYKKISKELDEANLSVSSLKEQNAMQQRTIEFLEDEREKMQQLNTKLSTQFESLHLKVQDFLKDDLKSDSITEDNRSSCLDTMVKSLNDQVESLSLENSRLSNVQNELQARLKNLQEEKAVLLASEQKLKFDYNKNFKKISVLEQNMDSLRKDYLQTHEILQQTTIDKEILEEEKQKFSSILSNLEHQCFDLKNCLHQLKDEENVVRESLVAVQTLSETLSMEKNDLSKLLNDATAELENLRGQQSQEKVKCEKEKDELKTRLDKLSDKCLELESENEKLQKYLQDTESVKCNIEEEKSQINLHNTDLTNQVTKYSSQKKNIETELEKVKEELQEHIEQLEKINLENSSLLRSKTELAIKLETLENEISELNEMILVLREEKANLEKTLFDAQKTKGSVQEEKTDLLRDLDCQKSSVANMQAQIKDLQEQHKKYVDDTANEKHSLMMKMQEIEQEFQVSFQKEREQHNVDIDILTQEKETLRERLVSAVDELMQTHQKQQDELINAHQEEVAALRKQISSLEIEFEEKNELFIAEKKKIEGEFKQHISSLETSIEELKQELLDNDSTIASLEEKIHQYESEKEKLLQEHMLAEQRLKDEIENINLENTRNYKDLQSELKDLREFKESAEENENRLKLQIRDIEDKNKNLSKELNETSSNFNIEKSSVSELEDKISLLQNQLSDEKNLNEVINKSLDDCKQRLKFTQAENVELKAQIDEANQQINVLENTGSKRQATIVDLKNNLREIEKYRLDLKREVSILKNKLTMHESTLKLREQEIAELVALRNKDEAKEDELKKEILSLKQKLLESSASSEALMKEMSSSKQKLSGMEHKLRMQQEQHHSVLQESLTNELTLSEYRLNLERSMADTTKEIHRLKSNLNLEEGKVLALEARVVKLDGAKRDVENKLFSICLFLRSALGLGSDSGFLSISANMPFSPSAKSEKSAESFRSSSRESPHRVNFSKSASQTQFCVTDHDIDLLKSTLIEMVEKHSSTEKERDNLKDSVARFHKQEEDLRNEHGKCITKIYQLQKELEDKKRLEKDLATKIASIHHHEEVIRTLEREKRRLKEKVGNLDFNLTEVTKEKETLSEKIEEIKKTVSKYELELRSVTSAKEQAESKASKYFQSHQHIETDISSLKESITKKEQETRSLEHKLQTTNKKLLASENRNKSLQATIEKLNSAVEKHIDNEQLLQQKVNSLSKTLSQGSGTQPNAYQELEKVRKERRKFENEISYLQQSLDKARNLADDYELKYKLLQAEVEDLRKNLNQSYEKDNEKIKNLQDLLLKSKELQRESTHETSQLQIQKSSLEKKLSEISTSLREYKEKLFEKEETCLVLEKEKKSLQKALDKIEKEKQRTSDETAKYLLEKSSLGHTLTKMEIENAALQEKVQNLQAQLAELEERHAQRVKDFLKSQSIESKLEDERLRTALRHSEQLMQAREKTHRQRELGLEEQIAVLKRHLEQDKLRWQQYHQRSVTANADINYLHSVISKSLQNVSDDPQKLLPEAERLELTTEVELSSTPGISVSTPSKLSQSSFRSQRTSTPLLKRRLDMSPKS